MTLRLVTTETAGLVPLGTPTQRSYDLIVQTVEKHLGLESTRLFAEPVFSPRGDTIDWYATRTGRAQRLDQADDAEISSVREKLASAFNQISDLADSLSAGGEADSERLAQALRNALEIPDEESIYSVGGEPVITNWAHRHDDHRSPTGVLAAMVRSTRKPAAKPSPEAPPDRGADTPAAEIETEDKAGTVESAEPETVQRTRVPLLWWIGAALLGMLIIADLYLLIRPCGIRGPSWLNRCPGGVTADGTIDNLQKENTELAALVAVLEQRLTGGQIACRTSSTTMTRLPLPTTGSAGQGRPVLVPPVTAPIIVDPAIPTPGVLVTEPAGPLPQSGGNGNGVDLATVTPGAGGQSSTPPNAGTGSAPVEEEVGQKNGQSPGDDENESVEGLDSPAGPTDGAGGAEGSSTEAENAEIDRRLDNENAEMGTVSFTLVWDDQSDLDLQLTCPSGEIISYRQRDACGGALNVEGNWNGEQLTGTPIEHIFFEDDPAEGLYHVQVGLFTAPPDLRGETHAFTMRIKFGSETQLYPGEVGAANPRWNKSFEYKR